MACCGQSCTSTASAVRRQVRPAFLKSPTSSFFFRIHADDGFASRLKPFALFGDVPELGLALRRRAARLGAPGVELGLSLRSVGTFEPMRRYQGQKAGL